MSLSMDDIMRASFGSSEDISCAVKRLLTLGSMKAK